MTLMLSPRRASGLLLRVVALLAITGAAAQYAIFVLGRNHVFGLVPLFDLGKERNVPTWFSSAELLLCATLLALIAAAKRRQRDPYRRHWLGLALIFVFLSVDEVATIHETVARLLRDEFDLGGALYAAWVLPFGLGLLALGVVYLGFLAHLPSATRRLFLAAGAVYVGAAAGLEMVAAPRLEAFRARMKATGRSASGLLPPELGALGSIEELLEMLALVVFAYALLVYLGRHVGEIHIRIADPAAPSFPEA